MGMNVHARITRSRYYAARDAEERLTLAKARLQAARSAGDLEQVTECNGVIKEATAQINAPGPWGRLTATQLMVLWVIALQCDEGIGTGYNIDRPGGTWVSHVSIKTIMTMTNLGKTAVSNATRELERLGFLEVQSGKDSGKTNTWRVVDALNGAPVRPDRLRKKTPRATPSPVAEPAPGASAEYDITVEAEVIEDDDAELYSFAAGGGDAEFSQMFGDAVAMGGI